MGIESFNSWIKHYFYRCFVNTIRPIDVLCVDFSDTLHNCFHKGPDYLQICKQQSFVHLHNMCIRYKPSTMYVSFDGVPPFMKMKLKRSNLYSCKYTDARDPDSVPETLDIALKACTTFINEVESDLRQLILTPYIGTSNVIINSTNSPGEGEYKIIDYINTLPNDLVKCISSPDSDMIMLSLLSNKNNIFIINNDTKSRLPHYLSIDLLRYELTKFFGYIVDPSNIPFMLNVIRHFCIVCLTMFKNDYVPMTFIKYNFTDVMFAYKRYVSYVGLNFFDGDKILFNNILNMMRYIDRSRFLKYNATSYTYATFDFVDVDGSSITSTKFEIGTGDLIENGDIYNIIYDKVKPSVSKDTFIMNSCCDYLYLVDWMFNYYSRTPRLNMKFNYNFSFIPLISTVYNTLHDKLFIFRFNRYKQSVLFNRNGGYFTNEKFVLYTFDPLRLSKIKAKIGYNTDTNTEIVQSDLDLFTQFVPREMMTKLVTIPQIHTNSFILMKVQVHTRDEDNYIVLSYGSDIDTHLLYYLR